MAIDVLQNKIKKCSNVLMVDLSVTEADIPPAFLEAAGDNSACFLYAKLLLEALKGIVPAVKFRLLPFVLRGGEGVEQLTRVLNMAHSFGFYTLLEVTAASSIEDAELAAKQIWSDNSIFPCDAIQISGLYGSDIIKPFLPAVESLKKDLFVTARSAFKSSSEIQDLLSGSRTVHQAVADIANRYSDLYVGKYGYSRVCITASAHPADSLRILRSKYQHLFFLIDGFEMPGHNSKNCSFGFDKLGHGAIISIGSSVTQAWKSCEGADADFAAAAVEAVKKTQRRLDRYITVL